MSDYAERKADRVMRTYSHDGGLRQLITAAIREAVHDQRQACVDALLATNLKPWDGSEIIREVKTVLHQAVLNAEVKGE